MPLFDFKCDVCGNTAEYLMRLGEPNPEVCLNCGACDSMIKQLGRTTFQLKGDGWAKDLYHKPKKK